MISLITSINKQLYEKYGNRFIKEFLLHSSGDINLVVVFEGQIPINFPNDRRVQAIPFISSSYDKFLLFFGKLYEARGLHITEITHTNGQRGINLEWDFRFDAFRFCFKIFSLHIALPKVNTSDFFAWIDADLRCVSNFSKSDLIHFMPNSDEIMSYLGRNKFPPNNPYSECGFLGFNPTHPETFNFLKRMEDLYISGELFSQQEWHDSWLWDVVRKEFQLKGFLFKNLSKDIPDIEHPFINCGLGRYFDHLKGPTRKEIGRSFSKDFIKKSAL